MVVQGRSDTMRDAGSERTESRQERAQAALQLWNKWATDALGPMSSEPSPEDLSKRNKRVQRLERECAALAAQAQHRLELSAAIRSQAPLSLGASSGSPTGKGGSSLQLQTGSFGREAQYALRESRRAAAYAAAREQGAAEAEAASPSGRGSAAPMYSSPGTSLKSRALLDALLAGRGAYGGAAASPRATARPQSAAAHRADAGGAGPHLRPRSAAHNTALGSAAGRALSRQGSTAGGGGPPSPRALGRSAMTARAAAPASGGGGGGHYSPGPASPGASYSPGPHLGMRGAQGTGPNLSGAKPFAPGVVALPEAEYAALQAEVESAAERLAATQVGAWLARRRVLLHGIAS
jgi:hypothetical protein